jgi:histidine triad (HIT) family protein
MNNFTHEPEDYTCPFCAFLNGRETDYNRKSDVVYQNEHTVAFISPKWWPHNPGHVLVIPRKHFENIYIIPNEMLVEVYKTVKKVATAIRNTYDCEGISTRQHNEPAGNQDVWHFHVHVYPRYDNDNLYNNHDNVELADATMRFPYAKKLRAYFNKHS